MKAEEELELWRCWRERCALGRLEEADRAVLELRIGERFRSRLRQLNAHRNGRVPQMPGDRECAHGFETFCALHRRRDGKSYKHWLLTRGRRDLDTVQSGVMLLIRNVVKDWLRDREPENKGLSLEKEIGGMTLAQCLPAEDSLKGMGEMRAWLEERLPEWTRCMREEEAAGLRIRAKGWVLSDPRVRTETGFGKSTLHKYHRALMVRWAEALRSVFPEADPEAAAFLLLDAMDRTGEILLEIFAENDGNAAFGEVEVHDDD